MLKRVLDGLVAAGVLLLAAPLMLVLAGLVRVFLGSPVLFRQWRPGLHGKPFLLIKFRTMRDAVDAGGSPLPDAERMTRFGSFLRATSLDELPSFWNVLVGELSVVGPRPLLMQYLERYSPEQSRRHEVRPGITGWAQVNGRNAVEWEERFKLDVWYVDHRSLRLDLKILLLTILKVVKRSDVSAEGHVTMPEFQGNKRENEQR